MDVGGWLRILGLGKYEAAFRDNAIDEQVLPHLTAEDLKEIGVATVGDRRKLLAAIAELATPSPSMEPRSPPIAAQRPKTPEVSAERRPITVMFCDLVGSTSLAANLDAEDWRNFVNAYLDAASAAVTRIWRACAEEARRRADGALRLSAGAGERCRARGAGGARHPARARRTQRENAGSGRAGACRPHRHRTPGRSWSTRRAKCLAMRPISPRACKASPSRER